MACPYRHREEVSADDVLNMSRDDSYDIEKKVNDDLMGFHR